MKSLAVALFLVLIAKAEAQTVSALAIADDFYKTGNYSEAIEGYLGLSETEYAFQIAKSYEAIGNSNESIKYYKIGLKNDPENQVALSNYGKLLSSTGQLIKADSVFADLISLYPTNPNHFYQRGVLAEKRKDSMAAAFAQTCAQADDAEGVAFSGDWPHKWCAIDRVGDWPVHDRTNAGLFQRWHPFKCASQDVHNPI